MSSSLFKASPENVPAIDIPRNSFISVITKEKLTKIIREEVALIPTSVTGQKQISEHFSKNFEKILAGLNPNWRWSKGDDNKPDISDLSTGDRIEIKVAVNPNRIKNPTKISRSLEWRGGVVAGRLREGWHLLFVRSKDNANWAAFFVELTQSDWKSQKGYGAHVLKFNTLINHETCIPVLNNSNSSYLVEEFLPDYSRVDIDRRNKAVAAYKELTLEEKSSFLQQTGI